jgi:hypothetical protein
MKQQWAGETIFANPPWGAAALRAFTRRAWRESVLNGVTSVLIIPAKTDQDWWHLYAMQAERRFIPGRVVFGGATGSYAGGVIVLVFGPDVTPRSTTMARADRR